MYIGIIDSWIKGKEYFENKNLDGNGVIKREYYIKEDGRHKLLELNIPELEEDEQSIFISIKQTDIGSTVYSWVLMKKSQTMNGI